MKRSILGSLLILCLVDVTHGAEECPFIRPPGLTAADVDQVVVEGARRYLGRPLGAEYPDQTFELLAKDDYSIIPYSTTALYASQKLGYDLIGKFWNAAQERAGRPESVLTIADMQALAREAYFSGRDSAFPPAGREKYQLQGISVGSPQPSSGWSLLRCGTEVGVWFKRIQPDQSGASTATASIVNLPMPTTKDQFLQFVKSFVAEMLPPGVSVDGAGVQYASGTRVPCAEFSASGSTEGRQYKLLGRVCYGGLKTNPRMGYVALYVHSGKVPPDFHQSSRDFVAVADPSR